MSTVDEVEAAVQRMSPEERAEFRAWYAEFDADEWDRELKADAVSGRRDWLIIEARQDQQAGRCTDR